MAYRTTEKAAERTTSTRAPKRADASGKAGTTRAPAPKLKDAGPTASSKDEFKVTWDTPMYGADVSISNAKTAPATNAKGGRATATKDAPAKEAGITGITFRKFRPFRPRPVVTEDGMEEHFIDRILDARCHDGKVFYLVRWLGYGPEHDEWKSREEMEGTAALDVWEAEHGTEV